MMEAEQASETLAVNSLTYLIALEALIVSTHMTTLRLL
jgi:hypothetical protein